MGVHLFESFREMIDKIDAKGVLTAAELERQMLLNDFAKKRTMPLKEAQSVLAFCNFLKNVTSDVHTVISVLPIQHLAFYRKTVERLVEAGKLPFEAKEVFDETFSSAFLKAAIF